MPISEIAPLGIGDAIEPWLWGSGLAVLAVAAIVGSAEGHAGRAPRWSMALASVACALVLVLGALLVEGSGSPEFTARVGHVLDFTPINVRYGALAGVFVVALGVVGLAASVAAWDGVGHVPNNAVTGAAYPVFLGSLALVFGADRPSPSCSRGSSWH